MSVQSLTPSLPVPRDGLPAPDRGDRPKQQTRRDGPAATPNEAFAVEEQEPPPPLIKVDLSGLDGLEPTTAAYTLDDLSNANEFLSAFSTLLASVGAGDVGAARNAATALQLELFGGSGALTASHESGQEAQMRMLDDLVALIRFARLGELGSAEASAQLLARDMQAALLAPVRSPASREPAARKPPASPAEPASLVQGATAAYESLMEPDVDAGAGGA